ncbi:hypothetical protein D3C86_1755840 [compost metagenome]
MVHVVGEGVKGVDLANSSFSLFGPALGFFYRCIDLFHGRDHGSIHRILGHLRDVIDLPVKLGEFRQLEVDVVDHIPGRAQELIDHACLVHRELSNQTLHEKRSFTG